MQPSLSLFLIAKDTIGERLDIESSDQRCGLLFAGNDMFQRHPKQCRATFKTKPNGRSVGFANRMREIRLNFRIRLPALSAKLLQRRVDFSQRLPTHEFSPIINRLVSL